LNVPDDTIVAVATPPGEGGVGIVRLSGPEAGPIGALLFRGRLRNRHAAFGHVVDPATGEIVDEAIGILMKAPRTYTREDTLELQTHAGAVCLRHVLELCLRCGARLAEPGEFTLRAFLNGRLDLSQAEFVLDVVRAKTDTGMRLAISGLNGRLSAPVKRIRAQLLDILAYLSARADFPDDDVPERPLEEPIGACLAELESLLATADYGMVYRQGLSVAIVGAPNVGKSSLLNRLLREDRAIVTAVAGTTRDTLQETLNVRGVPIVLTDTAGLTTSDDPVEQMGVARSQAALGSSDALLIVLDASRAPTGAELTLLRDTAGRPRLLVHNKCDLEPADLAAGQAESRLLVSALTGAGIAQLEQRLANLAAGGTAPPADAAIVTNPRHKAALARAADHLQQALGGLKEAVPEDLAAVDLRAAVDAIGEITGESATEDLLDAIFRNFCIGK
jgi:tRNA modification GTPase